MSDCKPTPFQVTGTPVDEKYCYDRTNRCIMYRVIKDQRYDFCAAFGVYVEVERCPQCLAAEQAEKEALNEPRCNSCGTYTDTIEDTGVCENCYNEAIRERVQP